MDTSRLSTPGRKALFLALPAVVVTAVLSLPQIAMGQTAGQTALSKCTDGNRITYSSTPCEDIGLKLAGQISDRLTVIPGSDLLPKVAAQVAAQRASVTPVKETEPPRNAGTGIQPVNPLVQGLMK